MMTEFAIENFIRENEPKYRRHWASILNDPYISVAPQFHLTWECLNGCWYCAFNCGPWKADTVIPAEDIKYSIDMFRLLPNFRSNTIAFSGGEPMMTPIKYQAEVYQYALGTTKENHSSVNILTNGYWMENPKRYAQILEMLRGLKNVHFYSLNQDELLVTTSLALELHSDGTSRKSMRKYIRGIDSVYQDEELYSKVSFYLAPRDKKKEFCWDQIASLQSEFGIQIINENLIAIANRVILVDSWRGGYWNNTGRPWAKGSNQLHRHNLERDFVTSHPMGRGSLLAVFYYPNGIASLRVENTIIGQTPYKNPDGSYKTWEQLKQGFIDGLWEDMLYFPERRAQRYREYQAARAARKQMRSAQYKKMI
ncbi:MAG: radical SAM protein [Alphaproteobacteria bacterium]|nr:radical SAM protein [Alphaproteobacteria bacterium]